MSVTYCQPDRIFYQLLVGKLSSLLLGVVQSPSLKRRKSTAPQPGKWCIVRLPSSSLKQQGHFKGAKSTRSAAPRGGDPSGALFVQNRRKRTRTRWNNPYVEAKPRIFLRHATLFEGLLKANVAKMWAKEHASYGYRTALRWKEVTATCRGNSVQDKIVRAHSHQYFWRVCCSRQAGIS